MGESRGKSSGLVPGALTDIGCRATPSEHPAAGSPGRAGEGSLPGGRPASTPVAGAQSPGHGPPAVRVKHADAASVKAVDAADMASDLRKRHETGSGQP